MQPTIPNISHYITNKDYDSLMYVLQMYDGDIRISDELAKMDNTNHALSTIQDPQVISALLKYYPVVVRSDHARTRMQRGQFDMMLLISMSLPINDVMYMYQVDENPIGFMLSRIADGAQLVSVYIPQQVNYSYMLNIGFTPHPLTLNDILDTTLPSYLDGIPDDTFEYYNGYRISDRLGLVHVWSVFTEGYAKMHKLETSLLRVTYPNLLYPSNRYVTDMSMFKLPRSLSGIVDNNVLTVGDKSYPIVDLLQGEYELSNTVFQVTRYSEAVDVGLYWSTKGQSNYCGTFYYYEPASKTYLFGNKILVAETKTRAAQYLTNIRHNDTLLGLISNIIDDKVLNQWNNGTLKLDMKYTPVEYVKQFPRHMGGGIQKAQRVEQHAVYVGNDIDLGLYAGEDEFDQPLCTEARRQGYDLVVLTRMIGNYQVVSEVLDTRTRDESLRNLIFAV